MALPAVTVEIAWDSGFATAEGSRTWTDVTAYVEGEEQIAITYGRADELSAPDPNSLTLTLDNRDGRFSPDKASSPYYPNVSKGKPIRVKVRYSDEGSGNFLSANQASMETSVADWSAGGSVPPTLSSSTTHADVGTKALLITWGTGGTTPLAQTTVTGLTVGTTYTAQARVWVPTSSPNVQLGIGGMSLGTASSTKNAFTSISYTFVATASSHLLQVWPASSPTSGHQAWVDAVMVDASSTTGTFTTTAASNVLRTRFTGYVDTWPLVWPDGSSSASTVTISATSRRARLGHTATLQYSPIRYAYVIPDWPQAYWPMDGTRVTTDGVEVFIDVTNFGAANEVTENRLFVVGDTAALFPKFDGSTPGPVDELTLLKFPKFTDSALVGDYVHYAGASHACDVNTAGEFTFEWVAVIDAPLDQESTTILAHMASPTGLHQVTVGVTQRSTIGSGTVWVELIIADETTGAAVQYENSELVHYQNAAFNAAVDGGLHHYAVTLTGGDTCKLYFDGALLDTVSFSGLPIFDTKFTQIVLGESTWMSTAWIGHAAVRDAALTADQVAAHAAGALTSSETVEERLQRLGGYVGVPAAEIEAPATVAVGVSDQSQKDRAPIEVADELAESTAGVLYDDRDGHLVMAPRNARYNQTAAFTLNATTQEIEGDLEAVHDDRYLVNYVTVTQSGSEDDLGFYLYLPDSVAAHGYYNQAMEIATTSLEELIAAGSNVMVRYGEPETRVSNVAVDLVNLSTSQRAAVLNADIGTLFNISNLPAQAPVDPMPLYLEGYTETISPTGHLLTANTTPGTWFTNVAVLDDASHDHLDSGITLAY